MIVQTQQAFAAALTILAEAKDWVVDVETDGFSAFGSNLICGIGIMPVGRPDQAFYFPFRHKQGINLTKKQLAELMEVMSSRRMLVGHNIKFDLGFMEKDGLVVESVAYIVDTAMMVRLTSPTWVRRVGLEDTIRSDYGEKAASYDPEAKAVLKSNKWHKDFSLADPFTLGYYCIKDIQFCDLIYRDRMEIIKKTGQIDIFERQVELTPVLYRMEKRGVPIDNRYSQKAYRILEARIVMLEQEAYKIAGKEFGLGSRKQVTEVFNAMGVHSPVKTAKTKEESWSESALITINHPLAGILRQRQALKTLASTFFEPYLDMITLHCSFLQYGTLTGRLSSNNPNAQNIPRGIVLLRDLLTKLTPDERIEVMRLVDALITTKGYEIDAPTFDDEVWDLWGYLSDQKFLEDDPTMIHARRQFVPRKGYRMIGFDYSQMEVRVFLSYLDSDKARELLHSGTSDFHAEGAKVAFKVDETHESWEFYRQAAKALTFGITYGQGLKKIATQLGFIRKFKQEIVDNGGLEVMRRKKKVWVKLESMSPEQLTMHATDLGKVEAKKYRDEYFANMEGSRLFLNKVMKTIETRGWVKNKFGRLYKIEKDFAYKGINYLVQGTSADIMNERIVEVDKYLRDKKSNILLQVHDELVLEVHESEVGEVPYMVQQIMETNSLDIPLKVEIEEFPVSWAVKEPRVAIEGALLNCSQKEYDELEAA